MKMETSSAALEARSKPMADMDKTDELIQEECDKLALFLIYKNRMHSASVLEPLQVFSRASTAERIHVRMDDAITCIMQGDGSGENDSMLNLAGLIILDRVQERQQADKKSGTSTAQAETTEENTGVPKTRSEYSDKAEQVVRDSEPARVEKPLEPEPAEAEAEPPTPPVARTAKKVHAEPTRKKLATDADLNQALATVMKRTGLSNTTWKQMSRIKRWELVEAAAEAGLTEVYVSLQLGIARPGIGVWKNCEKKKEVTLKNWRSKYKHPVGEQSHGQEGT